MFRFLDPYRMMFLTPDAPPAGGPAEAPAATDVAPAPATDVSPSMNEPVIDVNAAQQRINNANYEATMREIQNRLASIEQQAGQRPGQQTQQTQPDFYDGLSEELRNEPAMQALRAQRDQLRQMEDRIGRVVSTMEAMTANQQRVQMQSDQAQLQKDVESWVDNDVFARDPYFKQNPGVAQLLRKDVLATVKTMDVTKNVNTQLDHLRISLSNRIDEFKQAIPPAAGTPTGQQVPGVQTTSQTAPNPQQAVLERNANNNASISVGGSSPTGGTTEARKGPIRPSDIYAAFMEAAPNHGFKV